MNTIRENSVLILRVLEENECIQGRPMTQKELIIKTQLVSDYETAEMNLLQSEFIQGAGRGPDSIRWLTPKGIEHLHNELSSRIPLSLTAERILRFAVKRAEENQKSLDLGTATLVFEVSHDKIHKYINELLAFELIEQTINENIEPTKKGYQAVRRNFREAHAPHTQIQTGPIITGSVAAQNIQMITSAVNSQLQQSIYIEENNPDHLKELLSSTLNALVSQISDYLDLEQRVKYTEAAIKLKEEFAKPDPEVEKINKWIARLSLLDNAILVGTHALDLTQKALPGILLIVSIIQKLMGT